MIRQGSGLPAEFSLVHIKRLRNRFKSIDGEFDMIETLYGVGYRLKG